MQEVICLPQLAALSLELGLSSDGEILRYVIRVCFDHLPKIIIRKIQSHSQTKVLSM